MTAFYKSKFLLVEDVHVALWSIMAAGCHVQIGYNQDFIALWSNRNSDSSFFKLSRMELFLSVNLLIG